MTNTLSLEQKPAARAKTSPVSALRNRSFRLLWIGEGISLVTPVTAQENRAARGGNAHTAPLQTQDPGNPAELEAFLDGLLKKEMEDYHIAGAAVSLVKEG